MSFSKMTNRLCRALFESGGPVASTPLVFLSFAILVVLLFATSLMSKVGPITLGLLAGEVLVVAGVPLFLIKILNLDMRRLMPFRRISARAMFMIVVMMVCLDILVDYMMYASDKFLPIPDNIALFYTRLISTDSAVGFASRFFALCIVPGVCEEIYFRGFCQTSLAARWGRWPALAVASVLFAVMHPWYVHIYFIIGLAIGFAYLATGSLWAAVTCHVFNNVWTVIANNVGIHYPLGGRVGTMDHLIISAAAVVLAVSIAYLIRWGANPDRA